MPIKKSAFYSLVRRPDGDGTPPRFPFRRSDAGLGNFRLPKP
jgi:hypothetical protein